MMTLATEVCERRAQPRRSLVLLVGAASRGRDNMARALIARGHATVICPGPPGCILLREDRCVLLDAVDATVVMPSGSSNREVVAGLSLCAGQARHPILVEPSVVERPPPDAVIVHSADEHLVVDAAQHELNRSRLHERARGVADVVDIWL